MCTLINQMNSADKFKLSKFKTIAEETTPNWVNSKSIDAGEANLENYFSNEFLEPSMEMMTFLKSFIGHKMTLLDEDDVKKEFMAFGHSSAKIFGNGQHILTRGGFLKFRIANLFANLEDEINNVMACWKERKLVLNNISIAHRLADQSELDAFAEEFGESATLRKSHIPYMDCILFECDEATFEKQYMVALELLPKYLGAKIFTIVNSGGKSLHILIKLNQKTSFDQYCSLTKIIHEIKFYFKDGSKLAYDRNSDQTVKVRVAGVPRFSAEDKVGTRQFALLSNEMQILEELDENSYSFTEASDFLTRAKDIVAIEHAPYHENPEEQKIEVKIDISTDFLDKRSNHLEMVEYAKMKYAPDVGYISSGRSFPCPKCTERNSANRKDKRCVIDYGGYVHCKSSKCEWNSDNRVNLVQLARRDGYLIEYEKVSCYNTKNSVKTIDKYTVEYYKSWKPKAEVIRIDGRYLPLADYELPQDKRLILEEAHTGGGKTTRSIGYYANPLNVIINVLPYANLRDQKYTSVFDDKNKLMELINLLGITDEEHIKNILNAKEEGRCFSVCPEGIHKVEDDFVNAVARIEKATGLVVNKILHYDEVHNIIQQGGNFRSAFINILSFAKKHNMQVIGVSATIQYSLHRLMAVYLNLSQEQIIYKKYILKNQRKCKIRLILIPNNTERNVLNLLAVLSKYDPKYKEWKFVTQLNKADRLEDFEKTHAKFLDDDCGSIWAKRLKDESAPDHVKRLAEFKELTKRMTKTTSCMGEGNDFKGNKILLAQFLSEKDGTLNTATQLQFDGRLREATEMEHLAFLPYTEDKSEVAEHKSILKLQERALANVGVAIHDDEVARCLKDIRAINNDETLKAYQEYIYLAKLEEHSHMRNQHTRRKFMEADGIEIISEEVWNKEYIEKEMIRLEGLTSEQVAFKNEQMRLEMNALNKERKDLKKKEERENVLKNLAFLQRGYMDMDIEKFNEDQDAVKRHEEYLNSKECDDLSEVVITKEDVKNISASICGTNKKLGLVSSYYYSTLKDFVRKCYYSDMSFRMIEYKDTIPINKLLSLNERKELRDIARELTRLANAKSDDGKKWTLGKMQIKLEELINGHFANKNPVLKKFLQSQLSNNGARKIVNILFKFHIHKFIPKDKQDAIDQELNDQVLEFEKNRGLSRGEKRIFRSNLRNNLEKDKFVCMKRIVFMGDLKHEEPVYKYKNPDEGLEHVVNNYSMARAKQLSIDTLRAKHNIWQLGGVEMAQIAVTAVDTCREFINKSLIKVQKIYNGLLIKVVDKRNRIRNVPMTMSELREKILYQAGISVP